MHRPEHRHIVTADLVILTLRDDALHVGLLRRERDPHRGRLALIGAYASAGADRDIGQTAARALSEKTGVDGLFIEQLRTFSGPGRDPRGWSVSVAHLALVPWVSLAPRLDETPRLVVRPIADIAGTLPFDHDAILEAAVDRLRGKGAYSTLPARLLPPEFTLSELQRTYEVALASRIDPQSFRRKMTELGLLEDTGRLASTGGRSARLFRLRDELTLFDRRI